MVCVFYTPVESLASRTAAARGICQWSLRLSVKVGLVCSASGLGRGSLLWYFTVFIISLTALFQLWQNLNIPREQSLCPAAVLLITGSAMTYSNFQAVVWDTKDVEALFGSSLRLQLTEKCQSQLFSNGESEVAVLRSVLLCLLEGKKEPYNKLED